MATYALLLASTSLALAGLVEIAVGDPLVGDFYGMVLLVCGAIALVSAGVAWSPVVLLYVPVVLVSALFGYAGLAFLLQPPPHMFGPGLTFRVAAAFGGGCCAVAALALGLEFLGRTDRWWLRRSR